MARNNRFANRIKQPPKEEAARIQAPPEFKDSPEQRPPEFSLRYLQDGYCVKCCQRDEKAALADTLFKLSQLTWAQIKNIGRHGNGFEKISRNSIKAPIPPHISEDVDFIAFRFCSMAPMVGYRREATFFILWLDRAFTLYPH
ncbi:hypothetical protein [Pantoea sp.]|uniref:hypothetical protein n=1 Tax=Pantoea sp. TaxID=69393 RepID=UPI0028B200B2|nr:hypothetical protein [Pantoea sp.]